MVLNIEETAKAYYTSYSLLALLAVAAVGKIWILGGFFDHTRNSGSSTASLPWQVWYTWRVLQLGCMYHYAPGRENKVHLHCQEEEEEKKESLVNERPEESFW